MEAPTSTDLRLPTSNIPVCAALFQELLSSLLTYSTIVSINSTVTVKAFPATVVLEVRYIFVIVLFMVERKLLLQLVSV